MGDVYHPFVTEVPDLSEDVQDVSAFTYGDNELFGWKITLRSGKKIEFYTSSRIICCEGITEAERFTTEKCEKAKIYDGRTGSGASCYTFSLSLVFPDGNGFRFLNYHNGYYPHKVFLEIDGKRYTSGVPLMV